MKEILFLLSEACLPSVAALTLLVFVFGASWNGNKAIKSLYYLKLISANSSQELF